MSKGRELLLSRIGKQRIAPTDIPGVYVKAFSAFEYAGIQLANQKANESKGSVKQRLTAKANAQLLIVALCDEQGSPLFNEEDTEKLIQMDNSDSQSLILKIADHCGVDASDLSVVEKNSDATSGDSSPTGSPSS